MTKREAEYSRTTRRGMRALRASAAFAVVLAATGLLALGSVHAADSAVRGVAPADQKVFAVGGVKCLVVGVERVVPLDRVNDDYCDCDDGRDEPGTTACSHLIESTFYCDNGGYFSKQIHTSLLNDAICDCCDGSDEFDAAAGATKCANTCSADAIEYRHRAEARLADVEAGYKKRQQELDTVVAAHFIGAKEKDALTEKTLASLALLKERVEVHKAREERREQKLRLEVARKKQPADQDASETKAETDSGGVECVPDVETGKTCDNSENTGATEEFREVDALTATADEAVAGIEESDVGQAAERDAAAADESDSQRVATMVELSDGTKLSLADYLRMGHNRATKTFKGPARTADQKRREDFLGPLFNGNEEDRKRMGLYALRTVGIIASPLRLVAEAVLFVPRLLWDVVNSSALLSPYVESLPSIHAVVQSPTFRRLGDGHVYRWYKNAAWGGRVVWDAPIVAYQYLFPTLDLDLTLPEAESLRKVLKEIDDDTEKLRKERDAHEADLAFDYGPDQSYYVLKDQCIEKKVEKYLYKLCPFKETKQDYTKLGKWEGWGKTTAADGNEKINYNVMQFTKGQKCWNGPERSVKVTLDCGAENEIISVDEPSTCVYEMRARSYLACTPEVVAKAKDELAFWAK